MAGINLLCCTHSSSVHTLMQYIIELLARSLGVQAAEERLHTMCVLTREKIITITMNLGRGMKVTPQSISYGK